MQVSHCPEISVSIAMTALGPVVLGTTNPKVTDDQIFLALTRS